jgi:hypothetical protein
VTLGTLIIQEIYVNPHLDFEFPQEPTDEELADQVRQTVHVLNSLIPRLHERDIAIHLCPSMDDGGRVARYLVEVHKHL